MGMSNPIRTSSHGRCSYLENQCSPSKIRTTKGTRYGSTQTGSLATNLVRNGLMIAICYISLHESRMYHSACEPYRLEMELSPLQEPRVGGDPDEPTGSSRARQRYGISVSELVSIIALEDEQTYIKFSRMVASFATASPLLGFFLAIKAATEL